MATKSKNKTKEFDAVKYMRQQRDRISKELLDLNDKQILNYFKKKKSKTKIRPGS